MIKRTPEEKRDLVARIDSLRKEGKTHKIALKEVGIYSSQYAKWKAERPKIRKIKIKRGGNLPVPAGFKRHPSNPNAFTEDLTASLQGNMRTVDSALDLMRGQLAIINQLMAGGR